MTADTTLRATLAATIRKHLGHAGGLYEGILLKAAEEVVEQLLAAQQQEIARKTRECEIKERAYERLALCPDHRDKASGRCIVCQAEERTKQENREAIAQMREDLEDWREWAHKEMQARAEAGAPDARAPGRAIVRRRSLSRI